MATRSHFALPTGAGSAARCNCALVGSGMVRRCCSTQYCRSACPPFALVAPSAANAVAIELILCSARSMTHKTCGTLCLGATDAHVGMASSCEAVPLPNVASDTLRAVTNFCELCVIAERETAAGCDIGDCSSASSARPATADDSPFASWELAYVTQTEHAALLPLIAVRCPPALFLCEPRQSRL